MRNYQRKTIGIFAGVAVGVVSGASYAGMVGSQKAGAVSAYEAVSKLASQKPALSSGSSSGHGNGGPFVSPEASATNPKVFGKTYGQWGAQWWKWALSFEAGETPIEDETGERCTLGQSGKVWFLAGTSGATGVERYCTIPAGRALFYPVINAVWVDAPGDEIISDEEVKWILADNVDTYCRIVSTLDTFEDMPNIGEQPAPVSAQLRPVVRAQSPKDTIVLPENNLFGVPAGENERLIAEGYWVMLPPLTPGEHTLRLHGAACSDGEGNTLEKSFETEVTYHLTVVGGDEN